MKILKFEEFTINEEDVTILKKYGEHFPISEVKTGQKVVYKGTPMWVHDGSDVHILVSKKTRKENPTDSDFVRINQSMFNRDCMLKDVFDDDKK